jgi:hypothetical protein
MNHYRLDASKYEQHLAEFKKNAHRVGQLLAAIGSVPRAKRAIREAVENGRIPADQFDAHVAMIEAIAAQDVPDTIHQSESGVVVDQRVLDELADLLLKNFQLMRFSNFIIPPGCGPQTTF